MGKVHFLRSLDSGFQGPATPTNLTAAGTSGSTIVLSWNAVGATSYTVRRNGQLLAQLVLTTSYTDTGLSPNTSYSYTVSAVNSYGEGLQSTQATGTTLGTQPVITSTSPLPSAAVSVPYSFTFAATGGTPPYTWAKLSGTLPTGVSLNAAGLLSGTPSTSGSSSIVVQVTDSNSLATQGTFSLTTNASLLITTSSLPTATQYAAYSTPLAATGGTAPYTWSLTTNGLINTYALSSGGVLTGTPNIPLPDSLTFHVVDHVGNTANVTLPVGVNYVVPAGAAALGYTQLQWILLNPNLSQVNPGPYASITTNYLYNGYWGNSPVPLIANLTTVNGVLQAAYATSGSQTFICTQNTNGSGPPAAGNLGWLPNSTGWYADFGISYTSWTADCFGAVWLQSTEYNNAGTAGVINPAQAAYLKQWLEVDVWEAGASAGYQGNIDFHNGISGTQGSGNYQNLPHFTNPTQTSPQVYGASYAPANGTVAWYINNVTTGNKTLLNNAGTDGNVCNATSLAWLNTQHMYALIDCGSHGAATPYSMNVYYLAAWGPPTYSNTLTIVFPTQMPQGSTGTPYLFTLSAIGGTGTYTNWTMTNGPGGLSIDSSGDLSGTPTVAGTYNPIINVYDSSGTAYGTTTFTLVVS